MTDLFKNNTSESGPVECLGQTFISDEARREHFLAILREKLKDLEFRKIEGFPIGSDEDILALSDAPYYTACPNPFIEDFIKTYAKPYDSSVPYIKEPFTADVSEGKNDPIYNAHSYHTKVPHKAIMRYILHYTQPGSLVYDGFCGTGMTGVAAQMCGDRSVIESMGFRVASNGVILEQVDEDGRNVWKPFSKIGARHAILNDLSPAATFIAFNFNSSIDVLFLKDYAESILNEFEKQTAWMWKTSHENTNGKINYTVWSEVFSCPQCSGEIVYYDSAFRKVEGTTEYLEQFECPHCSALCAKSPAKNANVNKLERLWESNADKYTGEIRKTQKRTPVLINYSVGTKRFEKRLDINDVAVIQKINDASKNSFVPIERMPVGDESRRNDDEGITHIHHFYTERVLASLGEFIRLSKNAPQLNFLLGSVLPKLTIMNRYMPQHGGRALVGPMANTLYVPPVSVENNVIDQLRFQLKKIINALNSKSGSIISTQATQSVKLGSSTIDYIFLDPPFGANIMYSELSFLRESWLKVLTNNRPEAIENKTQGKGIDEYRALMTKCFSEAYRVLKPGRWMTVEFSNTKASVWNSIQTALTDCGFVVASVAALDKTRGGLHSMLGVTAVKQDLIISAYKPNGGLEDRFTKAGGSEDSAWDFVRTHLKYLPLVKIKDSQLEFIIERDPRIIFDRLVAWFVRHNFPVPLSSQEFQAGLSQRFSDRDGMVFLPEQVTEYDRKRIKTSQAPQMELFISDERSAIDWLTDFLKRKPSNYQEISPEFIRQLGAGWKKHEARPELSQLLDGNFLIYDSKAKDIDEVPSQIHSYLSTNWSEYRNLEKSNPGLKAKAADRWYVPDPNKAQELEKLREKSLLKEFEIYKTSTLRKLKEFRLEAVRAGFKFCWGNRDYATIMAVAKKIPDDVLQEDEKLLLWYDQAVTRTEDNV